MARRAPTAEQTEEWSQVVHWLVERLGSVTAVALATRSSRKTIYLWLEGTHIPYGPRRDRLRDLYDAERRLLVAALPPDRE